MGAGYQEMLETPISVIYKDLEMITSESKFSKPKESTKTNQLKPRGK